MTTVIIGGTSGIGAGLAAFLRQSGEQVITIGRRGNAEIQADILKPFTPELQEAIAAAQNVIIASGAGLGKVLALTADREIEALLSLNLLAPLRLMRTCYRLWLRQADTGPAHNIILISSILAQHGQAGMIAYSASKAGLEAATRSAAREFGHAHIRVNCIAPGYVPTEMTQGINLERVTRRIPGGQAITIQGIAQAVAFVLSCPDINGQIITIDGGYTI